MMFVSSTKVSTLRRSVTFYLHYPLTRNISRRSRLGVLKPSLCVKVCKHDQYLIEPALCDRSFTYSDYEHINCVRLHLQVATLSDISDGNGQTVSKAIMAG